MNVDPKSFIRTLALISAVCAVNFAGSTSQAPDENWEHLYEGSPLLIGSKEAWRLGVPIDLEPKFVSSAIISTTRREAVIETYPYQLEPLPGEESVYYKDDNHPPLSYHVIDLLTGRVRKKFNLPYEPFLTISAGDANGRLFRGEATLRPVFTDFNPPKGEFVFDSKTGKTFRFPDRIQRAPIETALPHLVCYRRMYDPDLPYKKLGPKPWTVTFDLVDFSHQPPKHQVFVHQDGDHDTRLMDENLFLFYTEFVSVSKRIFWKTKLNTGQKFSLSPIEYESLEKKLGIDYPKILLELDQRFQAGLFVKDPSGGMRPEVRIDDEMLFYEVKCDPPTFIYWSRGKGTLIHTTKVNHKAAVIELTNYARQRARGFAMEAAKIIKQLTLRNSRLLPKSAELSNEVGSNKMAKDVPLDKFVWTGLSGQKLSEIPSPQQFELGHLLGPGGSAVIFGDFRVEWRADS